MHRPLFDQVLALQLFKRAKDELKRLWHDAFAHLINLAQHAHRVSLTSASLPIDEVSTIVAIEHVHTQRQSCLLKDL